MVEFNCGKADLYNISLIFLRMKYIIKRVDMYTTFALYSAGILTKEQTLEALKVKKLYNQLVLTSEKELAYLNFIGTIPEEEF